MAKRNARCAAGSPSIRRSDASHLASQAITVLADNACHVLDRALDMPARRLVRLARVPGGVQGDDPIEPVCFAQPEFEALPAVNQFG